MLETTGSFTVAWISGRMVSPNPNAIVPSAEKAPNTTFAVLPNTVALTV